jgi:hypothetical protein
MIADPYFLTSPVFAGMAFGILTYVFLMGYAGSYIAGEKHRSNIEGIVFALLFGPLGLTLVACLPMGGNQSLVPTHQRFEPAIVETARWN